MPRQLSAYDTIEVKAAENFRYGFFFTLGISVLVCSLHAIASTFETKESKMKPAKKNQIFESPENKTKKSDWNSDQDYDGDGPPNKNMGENRGFTSVPTGNAVAEDADWKDTSEEEEEDVGATRATARQPESNVEGRIAKNK